MTVDINKMVDGKMVVLVPEGVFLSVPAMGTAPGQMRVTVRGESEEEVMKKLEEFYDAVATALWGS